MKLADTDLYEVHLYRCRPNENGEAVDFPVSELDEARLAYRQLFGADDYARADLRGISCVEAETGRWRVWLPPEFEAEIAATPLPFRKRGVGCASLEVVD